MARTIANTPLLLSESELTEFKNFQNLGGSIKTLKNAFFRIWIKN